MIFHLKTKIMPKSNSGSKRGRPPKVKVNPEVKSEEESTVTADPVSGESAPSDVGSSPEGESLEASPEPHNSETSETSSDVSEKSEEEKPSDPETPVKKVAAKRVAKKSPPVAQVVRKKVPASSLRASGTYGLAPTQ